MTERPADIVSPITDGGLAPTTAVNDALAAGRVS